MADRPASCSQAVSLPDPADRVWDVLVRFDDSRLYGDMTADIVPSGSSGFKGTVSIRDASLRLSAKPYDIKMNSDGLRIGIRVKPAGQICTVLAACSCSDSAPFQMDRNDLNDFLSSLEKILREEYPLPSDDTETEDVTFPGTIPSPADETSPETVPSPADEASAETVPSPEEETIPEAVPSPADEAVQEKSSSSADEAPQQEELSESEEPAPVSIISELPPAAPTITRPDRKKKKRTHRKHTAAKTGKKAVRKAAVLLLIAAVLVSAVFIIKKLADSRQPDTSPGQEGYNGSDQVSVSSALSVRPGDSRSEVEALLGSPSSSEADRSIYCSSDSSGYGTPAVAVQVIYEDGKASMITVLDLERGSAVGEVTGQSLAGASSPDELDGLAGTSPSMIRSFRKDGETVTEYHYGYLDPHMNFSPFWKGQLWAEERSGGITDWGTGYAYDGIDPLFHSSMTGAVLAQYDSFDDYLSDFLGYRFCLGFRSQPGRDESMELIPSLSQSGQIDETTLYEGSSSELLDDESPVWAYTMGFGKRGDFVLFSVVNRRLWQKENMLNVSALQVIRSGMPFSEAVRCMRILPSMIYIDYSYITFGFGRYRPESDVLTEQFEFCLRFTLTDGVLESVYDNTGTHLDID